MRRFFPWAVFVVVGLATRTILAQPSSLNVPPGCRPVENTTAEPYSQTTWAKEVIHEKSGIVLTFVPGNDKIKNFYIGKFEVTHREYGAFDPELIQYRQPEGDDYPTVYVSWCAQTGSSRGGFPS